MDVSPTKPLRAKWFGRAVGLIAALVVGPSPILIWALMTQGPGESSGPIFYVLAIVFGGVATVFIAIPGLSILDGTRLASQPRFAWAVALGIVTGVVGWWLALLSVGGAPTRSAAFLVLLLRGSGIGLLGTGVYWISNRWFERRAVRAEQSVTQRLH
jgi:hypothetical protein